MGVGGGGSSKTVDHSSATFWETFNTEKRKWPRVKRDPPVSRKNTSSD